MSDTVILGIGNTTCCDDGIGIQVARRLKTLLPQFASQIKETQLGGIDILNKLSGYKRAIIIDAIREKAAKPGEFIRFTLDGLGAGRPIYSSHKLGIFIALRIAYSLRINMPEEIIIYAVYAQCLDTYSEKMSPLMRKALNKVANLVKKEAKWL